MQREARARTGWASEERDLMWSEVRSASESGATLKQAFDSISEKTGRKPNSIRNYYYQSLKERSAPEELCAMRARPFVPFDEEEIDKLLRAVLSDRARGISVRACVQRLGGGDRALALRYQNKYRSILKQRPELIVETIENLRHEGIDCPSPYGHRKARRGQSASEHTGLRGSSADELLAALRERIDNADAHRELRHREELDRMTVRCDLLRLELARREELLIEAKNVSRELRTGSLALAEVCRELLSAQDIKLAKNVRGALEEKVNAIEMTLPDRF